MLPKRPTAMLALAIAITTGLLIAGCGGDDDGAGDVSVSEGAQSAFEELQQVDPTDPEAAQEALGNLLENVDSQEELVALCRQGVEATGIEGDQLEQQLTACEDAPDPSEIGPIPESP